MNGTLKNDKYKESFDSLVKAIKRGDVKKIDKQYNKTTNDLSKTFKSLTDKAEDIAKYVVRGDLDNYVSLLNKKRSNFKIFRRVLNKISGKDTQIKNVSDFVNRLPHPTIETAIEHLNISGKIVHHKEVALSPITKIMSSDSESELSHTYEDSGYGSSLDEGHEYEEVSHYREEKSEILEKSLQSFKLPKEEPIYATIPIEHIEAKRKRKQEQQSQHTVSPKLPTAIVVPEKTSLRAENQNYRQVAPKVEVPFVKEMVNRKIDSKIKAIVEKFEQSQVKEYVDMQPAKSKGIMVAQSGVDMKRNPLMNLVTEQCNRKPCKNSSLTHVNVKQLAEQFESYGRR